jgi:pyridoxine kinase
MARILSISSLVVHGYVGNSVAQFVLQRLGHEVLSFPSVLLSNHPGHKKFGGARLKSQILRPVLEALELGGHLKQIDAVMTGYLPTKEHVFIAQDALELVRKYSPKALYLYDPTCGDDARPGKPEGLYIDVKAAELQRTELLPFADIVTPNRFELEWLTMRPVMDERTALSAIGQLGSDVVLVTSIPGTQGKLLNLLAHEGEPLAVEVENIAPVPHGTGDMISALYLGGILDGKSKDQALAFAAAAVETVLKESRDSNDLQLITSQDRWTNAAPLPVISLKEPV